MNNYLFWKRFAQGKLKTHVSSVKIRIPSPKEILSWSERRLPNSTLVGKIDNAHTVEHDTLRPVSGGLFCERIFGPIATNVCACLRRKGWNEDYCKICEVQFTKSRLRRYQMGHILLAAPVIHIWALQGGYLANLLGKKNLGIRSIAYGKVMCQSKLWNNSSNNFCFELLCEDIKSFPTSEPPYPSIFSPLIRAGRPWPYKVQALGALIRASYLRYHISPCPYKVQALLPYGQRSGTSYGSKACTLYGQGPEARIKNKSKNKIKNLFLSYTRNLYKKRKIKNQMQKIYERGNVLPFHQFLLYKPDTFNKITQFFNSLDKEERNFPLPHYSKQKIIFCLNKALKAPGSSFPIGREAVLTSYDTKGKKYLRASYMRSMYHVSSTNSFILKRNSFDSQHSLLYCAKQEVATFTCSSCFDTCKASGGSKACTLYGQRSKGLTFGIKASGGSTTSYASRYSKEMQSTPSNMVDHHKQVKKQESNNSRIQKRLEQDSFSTANNSYVNLFKKGKDKKYGINPLLFQITLFLRVKSTGLTSVGSTTSYPLRDTIRAFHPCPYKVQGVLRTEVRNKKIVPTYMRSNPSVSKHIIKDGIKKQVVTLLRTSLRSTPCTLYGQGHEAKGKGSKEMSGSVRSNTNVVQPNLKDTIRDFGVFNQLDTLNWGIFYDTELLSNNDELYFPKNTSRYKNKGHSSYVHNDNFACFLPYHSPAIQSHTCVGSKKSLRASYMPSTYHVPRSKYLSSCLLASYLRAYARKPSLLRVLDQRTYFVRKQVVAMLSSFGRPKSKYLIRVSRPCPKGIEVRTKKEKLTNLVAYCYRKSNSKIQVLPFGLRINKPIPSMDRLRKNSNLMRRKPPLTNVKNVAYTGSSVLFQSLKNFNLVLLSSLISWKWKKSKIQLNSFLLQNKLTKKKRNLRNKLAKTKIILTKRKNLVQSFLNTKQLPEWMIISILPILPPALRPILELEPNNVVVSDLNVLYQTVIRRNDALMGLLTFRALEIDILNRQVSLQQAIEKLFDKGAGTKKRPVKSLSQGFHGKKGLFRSHLLGKRVDYSGRSVIVVGPQLKLHECGLPKEMALVLFLPFLIARLKKRKIVSNTSQAKQLILHKDKQIWSHLKSLIYEHPVLLNRAPTLHRLGFQAFQPILVSGKAMILPALVCTGFNADFDGDQMAVHVPLSHAARAESWKLLHAKNNMLSPATGKPIIVLSQEMILGCYCSSLILNKTHFMTYLGSIQSKHVLPSKMVNTCVRAPLAVLDQRCYKKMVRSTCFVYPPVSTHVSRKQENGMYEVRREIKQNKEKPTKNLYFTTFQEIYKALGESKISIQTAVWLRIPFFEDNQFLEEPLEIRLDAMGHFFRSYCQSQRHFSKNIKSQDQMKGISYIRTSAGRIQLNETFYSSWSNK